VTLFREFWFYLRENKKFWLLPLVTVLLLLGVLLIVAESSALAPFIYTLF
jgi:drug/metabolite transporter superfamily protein YnfA